jgi:dienelactone hydrolase
MKRTELTFPSGDGRCAAWLYQAAPNTRPPGRRAPCIVLAHGFGGVREARLGAFAERLAQAGIAAMVFDYRHFGASSGQPRQLLDIRLQLADWRSAIAFARSLPGIDPDRIAVWGTSFSGGHVAAIAARDPRLAAAISQNPFIDGLPTLRAMGPRNALRLAGAGLRDELRQALRRPPLTIPIVGPPGSGAAMSTPDAEPGYRAMFEPHHQFRNEFLARIALRVGIYRPGRRAQRIRCPWLVAVCDNDAITPPAPAIAAARRARAGELRTYPAGHFDIYQGATFHHAIADQVAFQRRHLLDKASNQHHAGTASSTTRGPRRFPSLTSSASSLDGE